MMHRYNNAIHQDKMKKEYYETLCTMKRYDGETQWVKHWMKHDLVVER